MAVIFAGMSQNTVVPTFIEKKRLRSKNGKMSAGPVKFHCIIDWISEQYSNFKLE